MDGLSTEENEKLSKFMDLSFSLIMQGFDEMEMQQRLEFVKLLGFTTELWFKKIYGRILTLEKDVKELKNQLYNQSVQ